MTGDFTRWTPTKRRLLTAGTICSGFLLALGVLIDGRRPIGSDFIIWTVSSAFAFNLGCLIVRWLVTRNARRIFLIGLYPLVLALAKLAGFVAVLLLLLVCLIAMAIGGPFSKVALAAFVRGVVASGLLGLIISGLLNALIVARSIRGTLAETSRDELQRT